MGMMGVAEMGRWSNRIDLLVVNIRLVNKKDVRLYIYESIGLHISGVILFFIPYIFVTSIFVRILLT